MSNNLVDSFLEIELKDPQDFLKIKETLTRVGFASKKGNTLYQSCHILHKKGKYYIVHFKELFLLDGKDADLTENDLGRRNTIATFLEEWGLLKIVDPLKSHEPRVSVRQIKIIPYSEKANWTLTSKYSIGNDHAQ